MAVFLSISAGTAQDVPAFKPRPAAEYPGHQTLGKVKFAAVKYESDEECHQAFGKKTNPNEYGVLPVYLIIQNDGDQTLLLDRMQVSYQFGRQSLDPVPAKELPGVIAPRRPNTGPTVGLPIPLPKKKNPLTVVELDSRAFTAKTVLKNETAQGFLYYITRHQREAILYIRGIREGATGKELFFVEIPIDSATQ